MRVSLTALVLGVAIAAVVAVAGCFSGKCDLELANYVDGGVPDLLDQPTCMRLCKENLPVRSCTKTVEVPPDGRTWVRCEYLSTNCGE